MNTMNNQCAKAEKLLAVKLLRINESVSSFNTKIRPENFTFRSSAVRSEDGGKLVLFSGAFTDGDFAILPFAIAFSSSRHYGQVSGLRQLALSRNLPHREYVWAFLSIIEYLEDAAELPRGALVSAVNRVTQGGARHDRVAMCDEYEAFCIRAAKDLPYDLSLEVLGEAA
ncbi:hypothetical protein WL29_08145 [Burkholderia ubonensis]|uniref:Uncharacterized protein n=1 Tax=Burkholderia ubonensis TaxID=101571 RepID=A0A106PLQ6_9BURK|nr:hypothetical protein [Burkholderia ubonensis]KVG38157.1 hypothetical protein WJ31_14470 [Burkholderia ubonensis]KWA70490.1 hypothetical protein WL29_08145 [Burkholderia ubonensis]